MVPDADLRLVVEAAVRYATYQAIVRRVAHLREDVVDVALLAVAEADRGYRATEGSFAAYAYWHYRGAVGRFIKKERRRAHEELLILDGAHPSALKPAGGDEDPMAALSDIAGWYASEVIDEFISAEAGTSEPVFLRRECHDRVVHLLANLSSDDQKLLRLRLVDDEPWSSIAKEVGAPVHVLRYRVDKLTQSLRTALGRSELARRPSVNSGRKRPAR